MNKKYFQRVQVYFNNYKKGVKLRKKGGNLTTYTLGLSLRENLFSLLLVICHPLSLLLVIYHLLPSTSTSRV